LVRLGLLWNVSLSISEPAQNARCLIAGSIKPLVEFGGAVAMERHQMDNAAILHGLAESGHWFGICRILMAMGTSAA